MINQNTYKFHDGLCRFDNRSIVSILLDPLLVILGVLDDSFLNIR